MTTAVLSPARPQPAVPARPTPRRASARAADWLQRLAAWAERQPPHRHLGSWTVH